MRTYKNGNYSNYSPRYCTRILENDYMERGLWKQERTEKDCYNALFRVADSLSVRLTALKDTSFIRFAFEPLGVILEVSTPYVMSLQKVLDLKGESKFYIPLNDPNLIIKKGPSNWAELLRKIPAPVIKNKKKKFGPGSKNWGIYDNI